MLRSTIALAACLLLLPVVLCRNECECKRTKAGHEYSGRISKTKSGKDCQPWKAKGPNVKNTIWHVYQTDPSAYPERSIEAAKNYCRNPYTKDPEGREAAPFCYTTTSPKWEYCDIPFCEKCAVGEKVSAGKCVHGSSRISKVIRKEIDETRCQQEIQISYRNCHHDVECDTPTTDIGDCVNSVRRITTTYYVKDIATGKCIAKRDVQINACSDKSCKPSKMDVSFLVDSSDSLGLTNYNLQRQFLLDLVEHMKITDNNIRVGVYQFSSFFDVIIPLAHENSINSVRVKVGGMGWHRSRTHTGMAFRRLLAILNAERRQNIPSTIVLITDGNSNDRQYNPIEESAKVKNTGVKIMVVAVGTNMKLEEMRAIASDPVSENFFNIRDFTSLKNWAKKISEETCTDIINPTPSLCDLKPKQFVSECYRGWQTVTSIKYVKIAGSNKCEVQTRYFSQSPCKYICNDPLTGSQYLEGAEWETDCHKFVCKRMPENHALEPKETGCKNVHGNCVKPNTNTVFSCRDNDGKERKECKCVFDGHTKTTKTIINWNI